MPASEKEHLHMRMCWQSPPLLLQWYKLHLLGAFNWPFSIGVHTLWWHCSCTISLTFSYNYHFALRPWTCPSKDHCLIITMSAMNAIKWKSCHNSHMGVKKIMLARLM